MLNSCKNATGEFCLWLNLLLAAQKSLQLILGKMLTSAMNFEESLWQRAIAKVQLCAKLVVPTDQ